MFCAGVSAQAYPAKPVKVIVAYAAGNVTDVLARLVADRLTERWNRPVVIDNQPGVGGALGARAAARAPADGYTLLFGAAAAMTVMPHLSADIGYDPLKDFAQIINVADTTALLVVHPAVPAKSFNELVAFSKTLPAGVNFGSAGTGTLPHLNFEALKAHAGLRGEHVPYKSAAAPMNDLIGGRLHMMLETSSVVAANVKAGKLRALVVFADQRNADFPDVPLAAQSIPGFESARAWLAMFAPAGVPKEIINKVHGDVVQVLAQPAVIERLKTLGLRPLGEDGATLRKRIERDSQRLGKLVRELNIKTE